MAEKEKTTLLKKFLTPADAVPTVKNVNKIYVEIILKEEIPVLCLNEDTGKKRLISFKVLYDNNEFFWLQDGAWQYYIRGEDITTIKELTLSKKDSIWELERPKQEAQKPSPVISSPEEELEELEIEVGFGNEYKTFHEMPTIEKINYLNRNKQKLLDVIINRPRDQKIVTEVLVDTTKSAALINHAALEGAMILADDEAKKFTQEFVDSTHEMVKSSAQLISEDFFNNELMNTLVEKSNGTIVQHMTRVYLNGLAFLAYYNNLVTTSSAIQRLRISFAKKYRTFYKKLLPHLNEDDVDLEHVFLGGMRAIPPDLFFKWAVGFLIHDIGKAASIEYHEGEQSYDRQKVVEHVKTGYKSIVTKTNYPREASLITGYHHEYYGSPDGYGYFRAYFQKYRKENPLAKQDHVISFELEPILDYQVIAYFPAKVLEIVDVYDSITDPLRVYRKAMTPDEALKMMREDFIERNRKLDIILFDIFEAFIREKHAVK